MLSIGKIALGQHRYYEQQVAKGRDDYYSGRGEAPGEWVGTGAEALGLSGRVSGAQFTALLASSDPRHPERRLRSSPSNPKVAALDLTFSAPKSVSVLAAIGSDELTRELILAHEQALRAALSYLEDTAVQVRRGHNGERVESGQGLIAAAYRHRLSRALDPQLHTHVVAANLARGPDGRYTALHATPLYRSAKTAGYLYQAHLRALVSERVGLAWGAVRKGAAELIAVPATVLTEFSKRRHEMQRAAEAGGIGLDTKASAEAAALTTRERRHYGNDTHTWREEVRARASELGLGKEELTAILRSERERLLGHGRAPSTTAESQLEDHLAGPDGLTERRNAFDERVLLQEFAARERSGALVAELRARAERFSRRTDVIAIGDGEMTTAELLACERRLIAAALGRCDERCAQLHPALIEATLATATPALTAQQADVVRATLSRAGGVSVIEALAGTGKTYVAGVLRTAYERAGFQVLGVAPTGRAARELRERAGLRAHTLERLLLELESMDGELPQRCVVIFDEAGMAATRSSGRLFEAAVRAGAKVVAIGDPRQLPSVEAGGWLSALARGLGTTPLTQVLRQRDPAERRALGALRAQRPARYLQWAQEAGRIESHRDAASAHGAALREWAAARRAAGIDEAIMIARENSTRAVLNHAARELMRALGLLGEERSYGALQLAVGDRVICRRNARALDVDNGTRARVRRVGRDHVVLLTDAGAQRELPASYVREHLEHAYALTAHCMQGATIERAVVVASTRDLTAAWSYTALSRARAGTMLLIVDDERERRSEFAPHCSASPREPVLTRVAWHMLEREQESLAVERLECQSAARWRGWEDMH